MVWPCYVRSGKTVHCDNHSDLATILSSYHCGICTYGPGIDRACDVDWTCLAMSEALETHPGYIKYLVSLDMVIMHFSRVIRTMTFVSSYTTTTGVTLTDFIHTRNGVLCDKDTKRPGTKLPIISGLSRHTSKYKVEKVWNVGFTEQSDWNYPNPNYSRSRTEIYTTIVLLNPAQPFQLNRGKLFLDLDPSCRSTWLAPFTNCWNEFVLSNPCTTIDNLYVTADGVFYGSPSDHEDHYLLQGYAGVPLILSYFRDKISGIWSKLLNIGAMRKTDANVNVPSGTILFSGKRYHPNSTL